MKSKLAVTKVWTKLAEELGTKSGPLIKALFIPATVVACFDFILLQSENASINSLLLLVPYMVFMSILAVSCHRIVLLGNDSIDHPWGIFFNLRVLKYLLFFIAISIVIGILFFIFVMPVMLVMILLPSNPFASGWPSIFVIPLMIVLCFPILILFSRASIILPACAIDAEMTFEEAFNLSRGNGWRLTLATLLPVAVISVLFYPVQSSVMESSSALTIVPGLIMLLLHSLITISVLSCAFRELLELQSGTTSSPKSA